MAPPPFMYRPTYIDGKSEPLLQAAEDGDLDRVKDIIKSLIKGKGDRTAIFSLKSGGPGVLHIAACRGHLDICKYLVEEHGGDANMIAGKGLYEGMTPFMASAQSDNIPTVKYFLDLGGDVTKADGGGRTVLHHAACTGSCKVTEFLLSKGIPVDIDCGGGTPLYNASVNRQDKTMKILLDHHANPNATSIKNGTPLNAALFNRSLKCMTLLIKAGADVNGKMSPLLLATDLGGYTDLIPFLLNAGADPNLANDAGNVPIELAASRDCREEVEMLFPLTSPIPNISNWSIDGIISHAKLKNAEIKESRDMVKSEADKAFRQKEYGMASELYSVVIDYEPDATLYSNRSLCKLHMGDGEGALSDACMCRTMRPDWAKACYRQAAAHMLLKEYKQA